DDIIRLQADAAQRRLCRPRMDECGQSSRLLRRAACLRISAPCDDVVEQRRDVMTDDAQTASQAPDPRPQPTTTAGPVPSSPLPPGPTVPRVPPPPGSARVPAPSPPARQDAAAVAAQRRAERQRRSRRFWSLLLLVLAGL